jgi:hypothetical protein
MAMMKQAHFLPQTSVFLTFSTELRLGFIDKAFAILSIALLAEAIFAALMKQKEGHSGTWSPE